MSQGCYKESSMFLWWNPLFSTECHAYWREFGGRVPGTNNKDEGGK